MSGLGNELNRPGKGIKVGDVHMACLFFADDIVVMAETEKEMKEQLKVIEDYNVKWKLETNYKKSNVMSIKTKGKIEWRMGTGKEAALEEVSEVKYLGVTIDDRRTFAKQKRNVIEATEKKMGHVKHIAQSTESPEITAANLWESEVKNKMLYASEIVTYGKAEIDSLEKKQVEMARWIWGSARNAAKIGLRGELGWMSIKGEIWKRKLVFWGRLMRMDEQRWPKKVLQEILKGEYDSKWWRSVIEAKRELGVEVSGDIENKMRWKNGVKKAWHRWEQDAWQQAKAGMVSLRWNTKERIVGRMDYVSGDEKKIKFGVRTGSLYLGAKVKECCGKKMESCKGIEHVLLECGKVKDEREEILGTKMDMWGRDIGKEELMRKISDGESQQTWEGIKQLIKIWEVNAEQGEGTGVQVQDGE